MNNFNKIFQTIKDKTDGKDTALCTDLVARVASIRLEQIEFYLSCLEHLGYIKFTGDKTFVLTIKGKTEEKIFA